MFSIAKFFLFASVFFVAIMSSSTLFPFIVGKYVWFRVSVDIALIFFLLGTVFSERASFYITRLGEVFRSPVTIAVSVFTVAFLLAGVFGVDPSFSFWSNFERGEGGIQIVHLYLFFLLLSVLFSQKKDWKKIFLLSMIAATLMIAYGVGAGLKYADAELTDVRGLTGRGGAWYQTFERFVGPSFEEDGYRFQGSIGNPAYVAAYLAFMLFFAAYLFTETPRPFRSFASWRTLFFIALFAVFFYLAATRGTFLGIIAGSIAFLGYVGYSMEKLRKWTIVLGAVAVIGVSVLIFFKDAPVIQGLPGSRLFQISLSERTLGDRLTMWKIAWSGWKDRPIFGYGPENFLYVFDTHFEPEYFDPQQGFGAWFDRAHSVVFDYLAETGIVGFLSYLGIFVSVYYVLFLYYKKKDTGIFSANHPVFVRAIIFSLPVTYFVQGLVLFDVLTIYLNWFLFLAFVTYALTLREEYEK